MYTRAGRHFRKRRRGCKNVSPIPFKEKSFRVFLGLFLIFLPGKVLADGSHHLAERVPVIIDTDMGLDDMAAIAALAAAPTVEILGVTTVTGAATAERAADNAARWLGFLGLPGVPVATGADMALPPPPWRAVAESMAGLQLPATLTPPEKDAAGLLHRLLAAHSEEKVVVLALGPLTNLARLAETDADSARRIETVYLLGGADEKHWNLVADPAGTAEVLAGSWPLRFLNGAAAKAVNIDSAMRQALAQSPQVGARGIEALWRGSTHGEPPLADAALAAAFLAGELPQPGAPRGFRLDEQGILREGGGKNSNLLEFDPILASRLLFALWHGAPIDQLEAQKDGPAPLPRLVAMHGHLGPYVVLGFRAGLLARKRTGSTGYFDLTVKAITRGQPPEACFIDGLQLGTGATPGKGNLTLSKENGPPRAEVTTQNGRNTKVQLRPALVQNMALEISKRGVGPVGLRCYAWPLEKLFEE